MHADPVGRFGIAVAHVVADQNLGGLGDRVGKDVKENDDVRKIGLGDKVGVREKVEDD